MATLWGLRLLVVAAVIVIFMYHFSPGFESACRKGASNFGGVFRDEQYRFPEDQRTPDQTIKEFYDPDFRQSYLRQNYYQTLIDFGEQNKRQNLNFPGSPLRDGYQSSAPNGMMWKSGLLKKDKTAFREKRQNSL